MTYAAKMDERVAIQSRVMTPNEFGEQVLTYTTLATVWAEVKPMTGNERLLANAIYATAQFKIRIRYRADFNETAQIQWRGTNYDILHIADYRREGERVLLVAKPA
jgi:SPP1 family predicted phage head-tail adaptor